MNRDLFSELIASVREGGAILRGGMAPSRKFAFDSVDIKRVRDGYKLSQSQFAVLLGISVRTLRNWEQGRRKPEGPALVLLQIVAKHPEAVWDAVRPQAAHGDYPVLRESSVTYSADSAALKPESQRPASDTSRNTPDLG
jgi:putative transcriptional regulator